MSTPHFESTAFRPVDKGSVSISRRKVKEMGPPAMTREMLRSQRHPRGCLPCDYRMCRSVFVFVPEDFSARSRQSRPPQPGFIPHAQGINAVVSLPREGLWRTCGKPCAIDHVFPCAVVPSAPGRGLLRCLFWHCRTLRNNVQTVSCWFIRLYSRPATRRAMSSLTTIASQSAQRQRFPIFPY